MGSPVARDFEPGRISTGETIAGVSGILLFIFLFFHWFAGGSAWSYFDVIDVLLAVIALFTVAVAGTKAMGNRVLGDSAPLAVAFVGTVAFSITLTFVLEGNDRRLGLWLAFFSAIGILYGGWRMMHEAPDAPGPLADVMARRAAQNEPTTPMAATGAADPGVPGRGAAGVSPGKEGPGVPHPGTSTGAPGDDDGALAPGSAGADPVPGQTGPQTPPGIAGEPPAGGGTQPPGL